MTSDRASDPPVEEVLPQTSDEELGCDGVHDETAPVHYLCTRCFPAVGGDLLVRDRLEAPDDEEELE